MIDDKAVFLLPNGCLTSSTKEEVAIRRQLINDNLISAVITLPDSMFESTKIPICIIVFDKHKETLKIEMIDMRSMGVKEIRDQRGQYGGNSKTGRIYHKEINIIPDEAITKALNAINTLADIPGFSRTVSLADIKTNDYILTPSRYIEQPVKESEHRSFSDIANDYNRVVKQKNAINIRMNKTAAKRLGFDCMNTEKIDLTKSFAIVGQRAVKENFISFGADDGIRITVSTKEGIHPLILDFLNHWKQMIMYLNSEENRYLAEFRDALLPELMSGKIEVSE